jgi:hypothetical protein
MMSKTANMAVRVGSRKKYVISLFVLLYWLGGIKYRAGDCPISPDVDPYKENVLDV